ncbi:hypothetical protein PG996_010643 [Apiospora saccharicola]|uniref:Uncharacterized protein n=1 Tax=Apiospora saccharicola TaxID=335842 RepID=A0ABR1UP82_9PEZI
MHAIVHYLDDLLEEPKKAKTEMMMGGLRYMEELLTANSSAVLTFRPPLGTDYSGEAALEESSIALALLQQRRDTLVHPGHLLTARLLDGFC